VRAAPALQVELVERAVELPLVAGGEVVGEVIAVVVVVVGRPAAEVDLLGGVEVGAEIPDELVLAQAVGLVPRSLA
jgi:hypothetical protein